MKLIYHNLIIFVLLYFILSFLYRFQFLTPGSEYHREVFELICIYSSRFQSYIPLQFLIGFYVQQVVHPSHLVQVVSRWWNTFCALPFPDKLALKLVRCLSSDGMLIFLSCSFIPGKDPFKRNLRRTVMRYVNLSTLLVYRLVSGKVKAIQSPLDTLSSFR